MKIIHRARVILAKEVEVPDELWNAYQADAPDEVVDRMNEYIDREGIQTSPDEIAEVEDEWYDEVKE